MLSRITAAIAFAIIAAVAIVAPGVAARADYTYCDAATLLCYTVIETKPADPPPSADLSGFTPGPSQCLYQGMMHVIEVPCTNGEGTYWSNSRQCYTSLVTPQPAPSAGGEPGGAWYSCVGYQGPNWCQPEGSGCRDPYVGTFWSNTVPPGLTTLTPSQAAYRLAQSFQLAGIQIGFAPDPNDPNAQSYVGVPIWMWVENPQPLTYGPYSETATLGGVTITATARVTSILWGMGDGNTVACGNAGTAFRVAYGAIESPTCGYRYTRTSETQGGGRYTITATSQWIVDWAGGGQSGTIPLTATSQTTVRIGELQSVLVDGPTNYDQN